MIKLEPDYSTFFKSKKVYLIWKTIKKVKMIDEITETKLIEIHSNVDKAWDRHIELNKKYKGNVSFSVEVQEVKE